MVNTDFTALQKIIEALKPLEEEERIRVIDSALTFLGTSNTSSAPEVKSYSGIRLGHPRLESPNTDFSKSNERSMSPKEFIIYKEPRTDVERVASLAYYLTHYLDTPHFRTIDISNLNTEAAQRKFSNATISVKNAIKQGYLVPGKKNHRQLSANGEIFVQALPDREKAILAMKNIRSKRKTRVKKLNLAKK